MPNICFFSHTRTYTNLSYEYEHIQANPIFNYYSWHHQWVEIVGRRHATVEHNRNITTRATRLTYSLYWPPNFRRPSTAIHRTYFWFVFVHGFMIVSVLKRLQNKWVIEVYNDFEQQSCSLTVILFASSTCCVFLFNLVIPDIDDMLRSTAYLARLNSVRTFSISSEPKVEVLFSLLWYCGE